MIKSPIAQHRKEPITASAGERNKRLIVPLALADLAVVVGPGDGVAQCREGRQEHRPLQDLVSPPGQCVLLDTGSQETYLKFPPGS